MNQPLSPYLNRFQRVLQYIAEHLEDDLSVDALSSVAAFSRFHFQRQFASLVGVGVARYVQLARLKRASHRLAFRNEASVLEIALDSGYEGPEAFARAFKQNIGQSPSDFRKSPDWSVWRDVYQPLTDATEKLMAYTWRLDDVKIVDTADIQVAVMEHKGDPATIGVTVQRFIAWRKTSAVRPPASGTYNIVYDDPATTPPEAFRLDLCAGIPPGVNVSGEGIVVKIIPGGRCAVLRHVGSDDAFGLAAMYLYAQWLPQSGAELRDFPLYCQRHKLFPDVPEHEAVTDLYLPLK